MKAFNKFIKHSYWGSYAISCLHCVESTVLPHVISDERAVRKYYKKWTGKELDRDNPKSFTEKLNCYKLDSHDILMQQCADKVSVRDYVMEKGYGELLNEIYGIYYSVDEIDIETLPKQFVLKASHGSQMNFIVKNKSDFNWKRAKRMMRSWLHQDIYWSGREWVYKNLPRRIIAEKYLEDESGGLRDYKFYCFNGHPQIMQLEMGRNTDNEVRNFYDMDWTLLPFGKGIPYDTETYIEKPAMFEKMKEIATNLCAPFSFVRVD